MFLHPVVSTGRKELIKCHKRILCKLKFKLTTSILVLSTFCKAALLPVGFCYNCDQRWQAPSYPTLQKKPMVAVKLV